MKQNASENLSQQHRRDAIPALDLEYERLIDRSYEPKISFLIPIPPGGEYDASLASIRGQDYPSEQIEIVVCIGRHRSIQRNEGLKRVNGEFVFFLDNDVDIRDPLYVRKHLALYRAAPEIGSIGGPSLTPATDTVLQRSFGQIFQSYFATTSIRARYMQLGLRRVSNERELILCNQSMRAAAVHKVGGFNTSFHSGNEENELINRMMEAGYAMVYDPEMPVYRSQRATLYQFFHQIGKYGKSRMEHFLIKPSSFEPVFLAPLGFLFYLASLPVVAALPMLSWFHKAIFAAPFALYSLLAFFSALGALARTKHPAVAFVTFWLYPVHHCAYALGSIYGLFRRWEKEGKRTDVDVRVYHLEDAVGRPA